MSAELAGSLRERVALEHRVGNRDQLAGSTGKYVYGGDAWASLIPAAVGDDVAGAAQSAMPIWKVVMRKRESVGLSTRLTWRRKYLAVRRVEWSPVAPGYMTLTCEELR